MESKMKKKRTIERLIKSTEGWDPNSPEHPPWSRLPATALFGIYQNLGNFDRISMATVCKTWYQGFQIPALWRRRSIEFLGKRSKRDIKDDAEFNAEEGLTVSYGKCAIKFVKQFATLLQDIEINFMLINGIKESVDDFKEFSRSLDGAKLRNLSINYLQLDNVRRQMRKDLLDSLKRLLQHQNSLQKFQLDAPHFDLDSGPQFLQCLATASAATIQELALNGFFQKGISTDREARILIELQKFTALSRIQLDYDLMSEELAKTWVEGCPNLSSIKLWAKGFVQRAHFISCETWKALVISHPLFLVELRAYVVQDTKQIIDILSPAIPLFDLSWHTNEGDTTDFELNRLLDRVANYHRTIKHLSLSLVGRFPNVDTTAVQNKLSKCANLLPFKCKNFPNTFTGGNTWCLSQHTWWLEERDI